MIIIKLLSTYTSLAFLITLSFHVVEEKAAALAGVTLRRLATKLSWGMRGRKKYLRCETTGMVKMFEFK
jgi:hypothetical protein